MMGEHFIKLRLRRSYVLVLHLHLFINQRICCHAQLLSAYEQAYGPWKIKLTKNIFHHRRKWILDGESYTDNGDDAITSIRRRKRGRSANLESDMQLLFPETRIIPQHAATTETDDDNSDENEKQILPRRNGQIHTAKNPVRTVSCILNLEKDGRFTLSLVENDDEEYNHDTDRLIDDGNHNPSPKHQPLKGEWYLTPNPYCVTDRYYDNLLLVSEPRMRRRSTIIEKATVELRCKIWGRHGVGAVREMMGFGHGRVRGRMTHGTLLIVKEQVVDGGAESKKLPTREIVGTFCGRTIVSDFYNQNNDADELQIVDDDHDDEFEFGGAGT